MRQFGHSGMISQLIDHGWHIVVAAKIVDEDLVRQLDHRIDLVPLIKEPLPRNFLRLQRLLDRTFQILESKRGKTKWSYRPQKDMTTWEKIFDRVLEIMARVLCTSPNVYNRLLRYEQEFEAQKSSEKWLALLRERNIDVLLVNTPRSEILHPALIAAKELGIRRLLFYHTIKDISVNGRIIHQFSKIGVWNAWMKDEIIRQNQLVTLPKNVEITGCAHFDCVGRQDILLPEDEFRKFIGANSHSKLLLYPTSVPWVVPDEGRYIWLIVKAIEAGALPKDLQIVIRTNPMDISDYYESNFYGCPQVIVQRAGWRMEKGLGWNFQRFEDMTIYNSLLHYASLCVGIPSTITIEAAISCLPIINLGFDLPGPKALRPMKEFWSADFYQAEVQHGVAVLAENEADLLDKINDCLVREKPGSENFKTFLHEILGVLPHFSAQKYIELINKEL